MFHHEATKMIITHPEHFLQLNIKVSQVFDKYFIRKSRHETKNYYKPIAKAKSQAKRKGSAQVRRGR
jgi:hypothetical protein